MIEETDLKIRLIPNSKFNRIDGWMDNGALKVRVQQVPVDNKANKALVKLLSEILGCSKSSVSIKLGIHDKNKLLKIENMSLVEIKKQITNYLQSK